MKKWVIINRYGDREWLEDTEEYANIKTANLNRRWHYEDWTLYRADENGDPIKEMIWEITLEDGTVTEVLGTYKEVVAMPHRYLGKARFVD